MEKYIAWTLGLLALGAGMVSMIIQIGDYTGMTRAVTSAMDTQGIVSFYLLVAISEETIKVLGGCLIFCLASYWKIKLWKCLVLSALAFALAENVYYVYHAVQHGNGIQTLMTRTLTSLPMHLCFTLIIAYALRKGIQGTAIAFCMAVILHCAFNVFITVQLPLGWLLCLVVSYSMLQYLVHTDTSSLVGR